MVAEVVLEAGLTNIDGLGGGDGATNVSVSRTVSKVKFEGRGLDEHGVQGKVEQTVVEGTAGAGSVAEEGRVEDEHPMRNQ